MSIDDIIWGRKKHTRRKIYRKIVIVHTNWSKLGLVFKVKIEYTNFSRVESVKTDRAEYTNPRPTIHGIITNIRFYIKFNFI